MKYSYQASKRGRLQKRGSVLIRRKVMFREKAERASKSCRPK